MSLRTFYRLINSSSDIVVRCPVCFESMTFGHFYHQHALKDHSLKNRKECIFCMGLNLGLMRRLKRENVKHVVECLKDFFCGSYERMTDPGLQLMLEGVACECKWHHLDAPRHDRIKT
ncbi:hypothetical protein TNCV_627261 [Trichonephila clavipes]|nr:hypothetical protein TNCV_627261 [Trichonephila clavipes]